MRDPSDPSGPRTGVMPAVDQIAERHPELEDGPLRARYALEGKLGRGGMGVIAEAHDRRVGRQVAIKRLAGPPTPEVVTRFVREARLQGRLDHPAIVPVFDLGIQSDGRPYFAMRRLSGVTLSEVLHRQKNGDADAIERYPRLRLLEAFVGVCLAIEYAHTRGVVHRDLKPANVMLGDFGEVYVLDWGVACLVDARDAEIVEGMQINAVPTGAGTVGYMAPEQARGDAIDGRADVYALGCILADLVGADPPAELAALCARAKAKDPAARPATARALAEAVERHLDVDRDAAKGAAIAAEHVARARARLEADRDEPAARAEAMREVGRALALDPASGEAAALVRSLLLEPPARLPPEVEDALAADDDDAERAQARTSARSYLGLVGIVPILVLAGVREWGFVAFLLAMCAGLSALAFGGSRGWLGRTWVWLSLSGNVVLLVGLSRLFGPFVIPPALGAVVGMAVASHTGLTRWWLIPLAAAAAPLGAWGLEEAGVLAATSAADGDALLLGSTVIELPPAEVAFGLVVSMIVLTGVAAALARGIVAPQHEMRRRLARLAWHLRHLVPGGRETTERGDG